MDVTRGFIDGMAISVLNPKIAVFFLALLGPLIPVGAGPSERLAVGGLAMFIIGGWYVLAAMMLATTGASAWLAKKDVWIDRLLGIVLVSLGGWLIVH